MTFKYNSKRALIQEKVYLYEDNQTVEGSDFLQKLATPLAKTSLGFKTKARRSPNNTYLVPGLRMVARAIL